MFIEKLRPVLCAAAAVVGLAAEAAPPTFRINSVFSNLDGTVQVIRLTETSGQNDQYRFAGLKLTSTHDGVVKEFTFPHDLPTGTAYRSVLIATDNGIRAGNPGTSFPVYPDFSGLPPRFLPINAGVVDFAGVDAFGYDALPTDGVHALGRDGTVATGTLDGATPVVSVVIAIEYYHAALNHYFVSASASDIDALDSGRTAGWQRTGLAFPVSGSPEGFSLQYTPWDYGGEVYMPMLPVCRFYLPPQNGDSHFLSASAGECAEVRARFPAFVLETSAAFYALLPDLVSGQCLSQYMAPVYRLWNARADTNHRYTSSVVVRDAMVAQGYVSEGYGPSGVAFCVPN
jgi:hypothetical protein